jgi:uncharacterized protein
LAQAAMRGQSVRMRTFLAVALLSAAALADNAPNTTAERLVRYAITKDRYLEMMRNVSTTMLNAMQSQGKPVPPSEMERFRAMLEEGLSYDDLVGLTARIYAAHFTDVELEQILAFYQTDTGAKLVREMPALMGEGMAEGAKAMQSRLPKLLEKYGFVPPKDSATAVPAAAKPKEKRK